MRINFDYQSNLAWYETSMISEVRATSHIPRSCHIQLHAFGLGFNSSHGILPQWQPEDLPFESPSVTLASHDLEDGLGALAWVARLLTRHGTPSVHGRAERALCTLADALLDADKGTEKIRAEGPRLHDQHRDARIRFFFRQSLAEPFESELTSRVQATRQRHVLPGDAADVDDRAGTASPHGWENCLDGLERAVEVGLDLGLDLLLAGYQLARV